MSIETAIQAFIDEVNDEYYADYNCTGGEEIIELQMWELVPLPFTPNELKQARIRVW